MATFYKTVTESLGKRELTLVAHKTETGGGEEIITMYITSLWEEMSQASTTWEASDRRDAL